MTSGTTADAIGFRVNGIATTATALPETVVADYLRNDLRLLGCKIGCDQGVCGACTVLVDGVPMAACSTFLFEIEGADIVTAEGLAAPDGSLDPVQRAFLACQGFQCGFCTSGMVLLVHALLDRHPDPDEAVIRDWLGSAICRCTGYLSIIETVRTAARLRREALA